MNQHLPMAQAENLGLILNFTLSLSSNSLKNIQNLIFSHQPQLYPFGPSHHYLSPELQQQLTNWSYSFSPHYILCRIAKWSFTKITKILSLPRSKPSPNSPTHLESKQTPYHDQQVLTDLCQFLWLHLPSFPNWLTLLCVEREEYSSLLLFLLSFDMSNILLSKDL